MAADPLPQTCLPTWEVAELPEPPPLAWRHWTRFVGPGIVMMGIQLAGGEWLLGADVTARYGGGLMWIATTAIALQVFYNLECGRYALYCGEPVFTGFLRTRPGPRFWMAAIMLLNAAALIPGLSTHGATMIAALALGRPPGADDRLLVTALAFVLLAAVALPVLIGGKVYTTLQRIMTLKVVVVLGFCLAMGLLFVSPTSWAGVTSGFLKFGTVPTKVDGQETTVNLFASYFSSGVWPLVSLESMALLGAFAGYAGGGGLGNATYSNFVRDQGWGMGSQVGAIPSALGGRHITLSHLGKVFLVDAESLRRWRLWWRYLLADQLAIWAPGCVMGMALPALLSMQFAQYSPLRGSDVPWAQALITADGVRHAPLFSAGVAQALWVMTVVVGLLVMLPSQMSVVDDFSRRWTDILWSGSRRVRAALRGNEVRKIYYGILAGYVFWSMLVALAFTLWGTPKLMTLVIANLNNLAIGLTSLHLWWINRRLLPAPLRPRWFSQLGLWLCAAFYLGMAALVFYSQLPAIRAGWGRW